MSLKNAEYRKVFSVEEALALYKKMALAGRYPIYLNGGTEIITMMRIRALYNETGVLIDLKGIPDCHIHEVKGDELLIGGSVTLAALEENMIFPLLAKNCSRIADHTSREKITIAGNICGHIQYKEALLPLLLANAELIIASESGITRKSVHDLYDKQIQLEKGSFIVQIIIHKDMLDTPYISKKMTKIGRIGYPVLTVSGMRMEDECRFAFSGLCAHPFRSSVIERTLNNVAQPIEEKLQAIIRHLPAAVLEDSHASSAYRVFVLEQLLEESLQELKEV